MRLQLFIVELSNFTLLSYPHPWFRRWKHDVEKLSLIADWSDYLKILRWVKYSLNNHYPMLLNYRKLTSISAKLSSILIKLTFMELAGKPSRPIRKIKILFWRLKYVFPFFAIFSSYMYKDLSSKYMKVIKI